MVGLGWGDCDPSEPRNRRRRASVFVEVDGLNILIDASPDCREQLLDAGISHVDAVLFTHAHADHCHGIDDLRWLCAAMERPMPVYGTPGTLAELAERFAYAFEPLAPAAEGHFYKPVLEPHTVSGPFMLADRLEIVPFEQDHGFSKTLGFRIGDFAYSTDVVELDEAAFNTLAGVRVWIVDALQPKPHQTHSHLGKTLGWIELVKPDRAILTHMNFRMDYRTLKNALPHGVEPGYDGMILELE